MTTEKSCGRRKTIQALRHAMTLAQEAEIRLKTEGLNDDNSSVMQIVTAAQSDPVVMSIQTKVDKWVTQI